MNPKLLLAGCIYTLTAGTVLKTNVFQINLGKLLFRATLKVRLGSCLSLLSKRTTWTAPILVKGQPSTPSTWPLLPTRLGIRSRDLGLPNEYTHGHCGLSETQTCFHKQALLYSRLHDTTAIY